MTATVKAAETATPKSSSPNIERRWPIGAEPQPGGGVHFRVWAPDSSAVEVFLTSPIPGSTTRSDSYLHLSPEGNGYFSGFAPHAEPGTHYGFKTDGADRHYPDPASRYQPDGPQGLSEIIDGVSFPWSDKSWKGVKARDRIIYEMHVGTFTQEGTWQAAIEQLPELAAFGITIIEVMPVADFPGRFGWGYDGVNFFAPYRTYGRPDDFRAFVDAAHAAGIAVVLDVVYNHVGCDANYLSKFAKQYFSDTHQTDWGPAINFDGPGSEPVREFVLTNVRYWIEEFHLDGLRLDATQSIFDDSKTHILSEISATVRQSARGRETFIVGENEPQETRLVRRREQQGYGLDALWNDDFHHLATVVLTGRREAYYKDYLGSPQEFVSSAKYGFLFQGQRYDWQEQRRGTSTRGLPGTAFVTFIQNHDQVANSARGLRCQVLSSPGCFKAMTTVLLLGPGTPMLFQGQEFGSSAPFFYFADLNDNLARLVHEGRKEFMAQFKSLTAGDALERMAVPADPRTFLRSKLNFDERKHHSETYEFHRELLRLRREELPFDEHGCVRVDGAVLGSAAFCLRFFGDDEAADRLLVVNYGHDLHLRWAPEPLLAPPGGNDWSIVFSTEDPNFGGGGTAPLESDENWVIPGQAAVLLRPAAPAPMSGETS